MRFWASSHSVMGLKGLKLDATGLAATLEKKVGANCLRQWSSLSIVRGVRGR